MKSGASSLHAVLRKGRRAWSLIASGKFDFFIGKSLQALGVRNALLPYPNELFIEPTNICNLRCPLCPTGSGKLEREKRMMTLAEFKYIVDQVKGYTKMVTLYGYGESFLNPEALEMVRYAKRIDMRAGLSSNGALLVSKEFAGQVVASGLDYLIISLDGTDQETLSRYRVNADFEAVVKGIKNVVEAKKEQGSAIPAVEIQFVLMKHNEHQKDAILELVRSLGVNFYSEKNACLFLLPGEEGFQERAREYLPRDLSASRFRREQDGSVKMRGRFTPGCEKLYRSMAINVDGSVLPCHCDWHASQVMGNVFKEPLLSIWKGKNYRAFRKRLLRKKESVAMCAYCPKRRQDGVNNKRVFRKEKSLHQVWHSA